MELRRAADALLRSQSSPLTALLTPSAPTRCLAARQLSLKRPMNRSAARSFFVSSRRQNDIPPRTTPSATSPADAGAGAGQAEANTESSATMAPTQDQTVDELTQSLWTRPQGRARVFPRNPGGERLSPDLERRMNGGTSASELLAALRSVKSPSRNGIEMRKTEDPVGISNRDLMWDIQSSIQAPRPPRVELKLGPSTGRSVSMDTKVDLARGIQIMEMSCARNRVKKDAYTQRFHERGGLKRKRLEVERGRKRFMQSFRATVARVRHLRKQGW